MHTALDTATRDRTLARYGARHHSRAYHVARSTIRAAWMIAILPAAYLIPFTL